uniref:Uncharacterized protein n=1 Tax=Heterorhabditis bacteriophora TaxID=37862 RepID=A0A1I7W6T0_HETBA
MSIFYISDCFDFPNFIFMLFTKLTDNYTDLKLIIFNGIILNLSYQFMRNPTALINSEKLLIVQINNFSKSSQRYVRNSAQNLKVESRLLLQQKKGMHNCDTVKFEFETMKYYMSIYAYGVFVSQFNRDYCSDNEEKSKRLRGNRVNLIKLKGLVVDILPIPDYFGASYDTEQKNKIDNAMAEFPKLNGINNVNKNKLTVSDRDLVIALPPLSFPDDSAKIINDGDRKNDKLPKDQIEHDSVNSPLFSNSQMYCFINILCWLKFLKLLLPCSKQLIKWESGTEIVTSSPIIFVKKDKISKNYENKFLDFIYLKNISMNFFFEILRKEFNGGCRAKAFSSKTRRLEEILTISLWTHSNY